MNTRILLPLLIAATLQAPRLSAETANERDFKQLRANRDKAAAAALEPINERYKEELDKLLKRATQDADLELANTIQKELEAVGGSATVVTQLTTGKAGLKQMFEGTDWDYWLLNKPTGVPAGRISFRKAGNLSATNMPKEWLVTHYEVVAPDIVRIAEKKDGKYRGLRINLADKTAVYEAVISTLNSSATSKFFIKYVGPTPKK